LMVLNRQGTQKPKISDDDDDDDDDEVTTTVSLLTVDEQRHVADDGVNVRRR